MLLNLSRDQLDRTNEVRMLAGRWRQALGNAAGTRVVANVDDPLVVVGLSCDRAIGGVGRRRPALAVRRRGLSGVRGQDARLRH